MRAVQGAAPTSTSDHTILEEPPARRAGLLGSPRVRFLLLGDWHPIVRDPIDVLRGLLLIGAALLLALDKHLEAAPLVTVLIVLVPRLLDMPRPFDLAVVLAMSIHAWGNLFDLFAIYSWFDKVVHVVVPMFTSTAAYVALARLEVVPHPSARTLSRHYLGIFTVTFLLGLGFAALYELYEFAADGLGAELQESLADTNLDLLAGAAGSAVGALVLTLWAMRGWGDVRRSAPEP